MVGIRPQTQPGSVLLQQWWWQWHGPTPLRTTPPPRAGHRASALPSVRTSSYEAGCWQETGITVTLVSHPSAEAAHLANRMVVMSLRPGRIVDILKVDLTAHQEYRATMERPDFDSVANTVKDLLGGNEQRGLTERFNRPRGNAPRGLPLLIHLGGQRGSARNDVSTPGVDLHTIAVCSPAASQDDPVRKA